LFHFYTRCAIHLTERPFDAGQVHASLRVEVPHDFGRSKGQLALLPLLAVLNHRPDALEHLRFSRRSRLDRRRAARLRDFCAKTLFEGAKEKIALELIKTRAFTNGNVVLYYEPKV